MRFKDKLDNYLYDRDYKIIIKDNSVDIINYDEIINFTFKEIAVKYRDKIISVSGINLVITKMIDREVLITGNISEVRIK